MSFTAHIGVTAIPGSLTLPAGAVAQRTTAVSSVDLWMPVGALGEIVKLMPHNMVKTEYTVDFLGLPARSQVIAGTTAFGTAAPIKTDHSEKINEGGSGVLTASKYAAFSDPDDGASVGLGEAASDLGVLNLNSVTTSAGQEARSTKEVKDVPIQGFNGEPVWRGTCTVKNTFNVRFKGDLDSGIQLGTAGAGFFGLTGGVLCASRLTLEQTKDDANGGSYDGTHAPGAS